MAWGSAAAAEDEGANWVRHRHRNMKPEKENGEFIGHILLFGEGVLLTI